MYALSTLVMHHRELFTGQHRRVEPEFDVVREGPYDFPIQADATSDDVAQQILSDFGMRGAYSVRGNADSGPLYIDRHRAIGSYRITYDLDAKQVKIERQRFGMAFFLEMLHRRRGFDQAYVANDMWAMMVDVVIIAIALWAVTGIWMWFGMPTTRRLGSICLIGGSGLFAILLFLL